MPWQMCLVFRWSRHRIRQNRVRCLTCLPERSSSYFETLIGSMLTGLTGPFFPDQTEKNELSRRSRRRVTLVCVLTRRVSVG
jgi:hypothetical protein